MEVRVEFNDDVYNNIEFDEESDFPNKVKGQLQKRIKDQIGLNMTINLVGRGDVPIKYRRKIK